MRVAYLLPDTNLFIQCKPYAELDWSYWKDYDEIHIVVTRPLQKEIDNQKNTGNARVSRKARKAASRFKEILRSDHEHELHDIGGQIIKTYFELQLKPDEDLADQLDYRDVDDAIVGTVSAFVKRRGSDEDIWLISHDSGPPASAKMVGVPWLEIPDEWLLPPEPSVEQKEIARLREEIRKLKHVEPEIVLVGHDENGKEVDKETRLEFHIVQWLPLTEQELEGLLTQIKSRYPVATDFEGTKAESVLLAERELGLTVTHIPAKEGQIKKYREDEYPAWFKKCRKRLKNYNESLQDREGYPICTFVARNDGSRPAEDVLVTLEAKGSFKLGKPKLAEVKTKAKKVKFPVPPTPPKGTWSPLRAGLADIVRGLESAAQFSQPYAPFPPFGIDNIGNIQSAIHPKDPNDWYWLPSERVTKRLSLECKQWRHGENNEENFEAAILFAVGEQADGVIECEIQAANIPIPVRRKLLVKISHEQVSVFEKAKELVEQFVLDPEHTA